MERITSLPPNHIFVFGSNRLGYHRRGAALDALTHFGAIYKQGEGLQGQSYAIPTKSSPYKSLTLSEIQEHIITFVKFAMANPELMFHVTPIGTGLAKHSAESIKALWHNADYYMHNIILPPEFK